VDVEKAVIGAVLAEKQSLVIAKDIVSPEFFSDSRLGRVFGTMLRMEAIDLLTVEAEMGEPWARELLVECMGTVVTAGHMAYYARKVAEAHYDRKILESCRRMAQNPAKEHLSEIERLFLNKQGLESPTVFNYKTGLFDLVDNIMSQKREPGFKTHIHAIDKAWISTRPGEVNTWAAATNVGKSMMLLNLMSLSAQNGERCLYVGTEMSAAETAHRHLSMLSGVAPWKIRLPKITEEEMRRMVDTVSTRMSNLPISILDQPEPGLKEIEAAIIAAKPQIVFLDYLERFTLPKEESMRLRVKEFMRQLKSLSRRRGVVVHLASQLNRNAYGHDEKRPTMAEISESSAVEKESDRIMIMWTPKAKQTVDHGRVLEVIQAKNRHGKRDISFDLFMDERSLTISEWRQDEPSYVD
jgi:replicative DNA helicase